MNVSILNKATTSDASPPPGYLFEEIAKMTLSNYEVNIKIVAFLGLRLNNRSPHVKWKTLLVIRHVSMKGSPQFKLNMMREHISAIKQCLSWTGPSDPIRGDETNQRVRDAAAHAIEALSADSTGQLGASRMVGMGSNSMNQQQQQQQQQQQAPQASHSNGGGNSGRMEGIGSEPWDPNKKQTSSFFSTARSVASKVVYASGSPEQRAMAQGGSSGGDMSHTFASNRGSNPHENGGQWKPTPGFSSGGGVGNGGNGGGGYNSNNGNNVSIEWNEGHRNKGVGGVWGNQQTGQSSMSGHGVGQSSMPQQVTSTPVVSNQNGQSGHTGGGNADGTYERSLIQDLCAPGGTRAVPPQDELNRFIQLAPSLSPDLVGPNLVEQFLSDGTWQSKNKALTVATSLIQNDACMKHRVWLSENAMDDLAVLSESSPKPQLCSKAKTLLALLRGEENVNTNMSTQRIPQAPVYDNTSIQYEGSSQEPTSSTPVGEVDLLGGFRGETPPPPPQPVVQSTQMIGTNEGMDQGNMSQQGQNQAYAMPSSPTQPPQQVPQQVPQSGGSGGSMFGNLTVKNTPPPSPAVETTPQQTQVQPTSTPQTSTGAASGNMFGGLMVKSNPVMTSNAPAPRAAAPPQESTPPVAPAPPAPVPDPFGMADLSTPISETLAPPQSNPQSQMNQPMGMNQQGQMNQPMGMNQQGQMNQPMGMNQQGQMNQPMGMNQQGQMNQMQYQQMMMGMNQMNMGYGGGGGGGYPQQQQQYQMNMNPNGGVQMNRTMVPMGQGMLSPVRAAAPSIPDVNAMDSMGNGTKSGSGFEFMGSPGRSRVPSDPKEDAFSFVMDSMKSKS